MPDNSKVWLNDYSTLQYDSKGFQNERTLTLEGEAYFDVEEGSSFTVQTDLGSVKVLGTTFNVDSREGHFSVECYSGKVGVTGGSSYVEILPGQRVILVENELRKSSGKKGAKWIQGMFTYEDALLSDVVGELERQFDIQIEINENHRTLKYTGFFHEEDLQKALTSVFWPLKLKFEINGNKIKISE